MHAAQQNVSQRKEETLRQREKNKKCSFGAGKQPALMLICAHKEGNGCFGASDWLKRR